MKTINSIWSFVFNWGTWAAALAGLLLNHAWVVGGWMSLVWIWLAFFVLYWNHVCRRYESG